MKRLRPLFPLTSLAKPYIGIRPLYLGTCIRSYLAHGSLTALKSSPKPLSPFTARFFTDPKIDKTLRQLQTDLEQLKKTKKNENALISKEQIRALGVIQHRLQREILLSRQKTALGRLWVRFKWLMIRDKRPFNTDDFTAMFSWILWGHILWIVLGTTTFISLLLWTLSRFKAQDYFATFVANIITKETGVRVVFEEAAVPDWEQRVLVFRKVFVSKRPGKTQKARVGSQAEAASAQSTTLEATQPIEPTDDGNYTQFDLTLDSVAVSLSAWRWLSGKGIVRTAELSGVRGVIDRRHLIDDPTYDPVAQRATRRRGFDFESFKIDDMLVDVQFKGHETKASIFTCELPKLRNEWVLYDFMNADRITGSYDNSLFTLNPRQDAMPVDKNGPFARVQRLRVDDVDVRNLNRGVDGMFGWIESGTVDFLADIMLPSDTPDMTFKEKVQNIFQHWEYSLLGQTGKVTPIDAKVRDREDQKAVYIDLRVQFNNTRASAPLYTKDLTYLNNALIHPIIAYLNSRDTYIPVHCRVIKKLNDFDGSWTIYDSGLMEDVSQSLYEACSQNAADEEARMRRIRKVGFWSLQFLAQLVLLTLGIVA